MNTCRNCAHWQTEAQDKYGQTVPAPMLRNRMAACGRSHAWRYLPYHTPACRYHRPNDPEKQNGRELLMRSFPAGK